MCAQVLDQIDQRCSASDHFYIVMLQYERNIRFCVLYYYILATFPPGREHSPLHNGLGLTPAAAVRLARRHARPINALGDDQPTLSALYYDYSAALLSLSEVASADSKLSYRTDLARCGFKTMLHGPRPKKFVHH